jgi:uncharacterized lipoprotein YajG
LDGRYSRIDSEELFSVNSRNSVFNGIIMKKLLLILGVALLASCAPAKKLTDVTDVMMG